MKDDPKIRRSGKNPGLQSGRGDRIATEKTAAWWRLFAMVGVRPAAGRLRTETQSDRQSDDPEASAA
jgi:hypothetical protein